jgi:hypothetical protein
MNPIATGATPSGRKSQISGTAGNTVGEVHAAQLASIKLNNPIIVKIKRVKS